MPLHEQIVHSNFPFTYVASLADREQQEISCLEIDVSGVEMPGCCCSGKKNKLGRYRVARQKGL